MRYQKRIGLRAFTLIELLVVMAVVTILAAILLPVFTSARERGRRTACASNMKQMELALTAYTQDNEGFFPGLGVDFPPVSVEGDWAWRINRYAASYEVFHCPDVQLPPEVDLTPSPSPYYIQLARGYAFNGALYTKYDATDVLPSLGTSAAKIQFSAGTIAISETAYEYMVVRNLPEYIEPQYLYAPEGETSLLPHCVGFVGSPGGLRHNGGSNYAFVDGHVHWYTPAQVLNSKKANDGTQPSFAL